MISIGYQFSDKNLLQTALTHSSYVNERRNSTRSNERLEFLGDSVLSVIVSEYIYHKFPEYPEGKLTKIRASVVCEQELAKCARKIHLGDAILLGKGEDGSGGRDRASILSDAFEAVIAAIFLDGGMEAARDWVLQQLEPDIWESTQASASTFKDYKTALQEHFQHDGQPPVEYTVKHVTGPDHDRVFEVEASWKGKPMASAKGKNKKEAEQATAKIILEQRGVRVE